MESNEFQEEPPSDITERLLLVMHVKIAAAMRDRFTQSYYSMQINPKATLADINEIEGQMCGWTERLNMLIEADDV